MFYYLFSCNLVYCVTWPLSFLVHNIWLYVPRVCSRGDAPALRSPHVGCLPNIRIAFCYVIYLGLVKISCRFFQCRGPTFLATIMCYEYTNRSCCFFGIIYYALTPFSKMGAINRYEISIVSLQCWATDECDHCTITSTNLSTNLSKIIHISSLRFS